MTGLRRVPKKHYLQKLLVLSFCLAFLLLIAQTIGELKDINDTWILADILPTFILFTVIYVAIVSLSANLKMIAVVTSIYLGAVNLIPQLKYVFIYGYFDPLAHFGFIRGIVASGFVPQTGYYTSAQYGPTPGSQLSMATLSIVTGLNPIIAMKIFLSVGPFIIPLAVYLVLKKMDFPNDLSKVIFPVTVVTSPTLYRFVGTVGAFPLYILFTYSFLVIASRGPSSRSDFALLTLLGTGVIISHDVTAFFLIFVMLSVAALFAYRKPLNSEALSPRRLLFFVAAFIIIDLAHSTLSSTVSFSQIINLVKDSFVSISGRKLPGAIEYYGGFYTLTFTQQVQVLGVRMGRDLLTIFLLILAPLAMFRLKLKGTLSREFYYTLVFPTLVALVTFALPLFIRSYVINRGLIYLAAFAPFSVGITVYWLIYSRHFRFRNAILALGIFTLVCISLIQTYPYQPFVPKIPTSYGDYYTMDLRAVTTIYDRSGINFLSTYDSKLTIAIDGIMKAQIYALTDPQFQTLLRPVDNPSSVRRITAQLLLVSFDGDTHIIVSGSSAFIYAQEVQNATQKDSIIYTNSKSCILLNLGS